MIRSPTENGDRKWKPGPLRRQNIAVHKAHNKHTFGVPELKTQGCTPPKGSVAIGGAEHSLMVSRVVFRQQKLRPFGGSLRTRSEMGEEIDQINLPYKKQPRCPLFSTRKYFFLYLIWHMLILPHNTRG